jgi:hypothetical protein
MKTEKGVRKNFIFHDKKVVAHIELQPNQSRYIEELVQKDYKSPTVETISSDLNLQQSLLQIKSELIEALQVMIVKPSTATGINLNSNVSSSENVNASIANVLSLL